MKAGLMLEPTERASAEGIVRVIPGKWGNLKAGSIVIHCSSSSTYIIHLETLEHTCKAYVQKKQVSGQFHLSSPHSYFFGSVILVKQPALQQQLLGWSTSMWSIWLSREKGKGKSIQDADTED